MSDAIALGGPMSQTSGSETFVRTMPDYNRAGFRDRLHDGETGQIFTGSPLPDEWRQIEQERLSTSPRDAQHPERMTPRGRDSGDDLVRHPHVYIEE